MGSTLDECAASVRLGIVNCVLQAIVAVAFVIVCLWAGSIVLEPLNVVGITTVPPGIKYVDYNLRH